MAIPPKEPPLREFVDEPYTDAGEFMRALWIGLPRWTPVALRTSDWLFRGQDDADDALLPSIWRDSSDDEDLTALLEHTRRRGHAPNPDTPRAREWLALHDAEHDILREFLELADLVAIQLPSDKGTDPRSPIGGLARHHGAPSSLLDFTSDPWWAAFWATCPLRGRRILPKRLAVWAFDLRKKKDPVHHRQVPRADNPRLHAQRGCFLWWEDTRAFYEAHGIKPSFDLDASHHPGGLVRLTLPTSQIGELRRLLELSEYSRARALGSLDGVISTLRERWRSRRPG